MQLLSISDLIEKEGERITKEILSSFSVSRNQDVEHFIYDLAIPYEKSNNARSFLFLNDLRKPIGFVSLAFTTLCIPNTISGEMKKRLKGFGRLTSESIPCYLIGQLARFDNTNKKILSGNVMFSAISDAIRIAHQVFGGRVVSVDCIDELVPYYMQRGFIPLNKIEDLNQMVYLIKDYRSNDQFSA